MVYMQLSKTNWLSHNTQFNEAVTSLNTYLNSHKTNADESRLNELIGQVAESIIDSQVSPAHRDEAVRLIDKEFGAVKDELRKRVGILTEGDIVCWFSQGKLDENYGTNACAVICHQAVSHLLSGKDINSKDMMHKLLSDGIKTYKENEFHGKVVFEDVVNKLNTDSPVKLEAIAPEHIEGMDEGILQMMKETPLEFPLQGTVGNDLNNMVHVLDETAQKHNQKLCGVLTCNGETVVVYFPEPGKPAMFDSHGRNYMGVDRGASLLKFDSIDGLQTHLNEVFKKPDEPFNLLLIGKKFEESDIEKEFIQIERSSSPPKHNPSMPPTTMPKKSKLRRIGTVFSNFWTKK